MKIIIAGSAKLQDEMKRWVEFWESQDDCIVLNYPKAIPKENFDELYKEVHRNFFLDILKADILFVVNEKKNGIDGYIGAETFAEMSFALMQRLINNQDIKIILAHQPFKEVACYEEMVLWEKFGWIEYLDPK